MAKMKEKSTQTMSVGNNKGAWTAEEDKKLAEIIAIHGAKRWKTISTLTGLNRCGKSCRLRWLNYLRPNIKRGNISDQEEDLILRLHKLLGNRWSLIAGRLPGRTDNEIKNYWNSHLSKKINHHKCSIKQTGRGIQRYQQNDDKSRALLSVQGVRDISETMNKYNNNNNNDPPKGSRDCDDEDFFDFSSEGPLNMKWMSQFIELEQTL